MAERICPIRQRLEGWFKRVPIDEDELTGEELSLATHLQEHHPNDEADTRSLIATCDPPSLETVSLAFACPWRLYESFGSLKRLYGFGHIAPEYIHVLQGNLYEWNGEIIDASSLDAVLSHYNDTDMVEAGMILHMICAAHDVGYITFTNYQSICIRAIHTIVRDPNLASWSDYAAVICDQLPSALETYPSTIRSAYALHMDWLISNALSPWVTLDWEKVRAVGIAHYATLK
ncbi:hypothetical protein [Stomatohabitans albus]|uniref:hypothetical protein n=1 Tax=Stomatohabitans albus TaxID=3110766 RepID=UPI00300D22C8